MLASTPSPKAETNRAQKARSVTAKTDSIGLVSRGVPNTQPLLRAAAQWLLDAQRPLVNGAPHFVASGGGAQPLHLFHGSRGWQIAPDLDAAVAYAIAPGVTAAHPNTIRQGEWQLPTEPSGGWAAHPEFHVSAEGPNTEERPFRMEDIGADFFVRVKTTKLVWFYDPSTGEVVHSGAKNAGKGARPGKRYCPLCCTCFSANNFVSQHIKNVHTPPPPSAPVVLVDGDAGALLQWKPDYGCASAQPSSYAVEFSDDGGLLWQVAIANTGSADPRARIAALVLGRSYLFRVATIGLAATSIFSAASEPFVAMQAAPPAEIAGLLDSSLGTASRPLPSPMATVLKMNASLASLMTEPSLADATAPVDVHPVASPFVVMPTPSPACTVAVSERAAEPAARVAPSLKRKASFGDGLTPALQEYLDLEIDKVLAESTADFTQAELIGDQIEIKLSIPVPKGLGPRETPDESASLPPAKRAATAAAPSVAAPSPPLTPPLSPMHASQLLGASVSQLC